MSSDESNDEIADFDEFMEEAAEMRREKMREQDGDEFEPSDEWNDPRNAAMAGVESPNRPSLIRRILRWVLVWGVTLVTLACIVVPVVLYLLVGFETAVVVGISCLVFVQVVRVAVVG